MPNDSLAALVLDSIRATFRSTKRLADKAIAQSSAESLRRQPDPNVNSIAVIMKHVAGNLRSRFTDLLSSDGEKPWRNRDDEFVDRYGSREEILADWEQGWSVLFASLDALQPEDLTREISIRGEIHTVALALTRALSHISYHVGQIVHVARIHAGDHWATITIPRGGSDEYNRQTWGKHGGDHQQRHSR
ncbi:MAG: DUF1572 family protein [Phycisphaerae bacterium]|jgi:uncharacterized damage-inducible protein DinB|nr:DUF1572 family protein [Phycisphaerae bacterium]